LELRAYNENWNAVISEFHLFYIDCQLVKYHCLPV